MRPMIKRTLIGVGVSLALVGGGSIVFAQTQSTPPQNAMQSFLDDVASHLGVQASALQSAIQAAEVDRVKQAVASGKMTQQQANKIEQAIQSGKMGPGLFGFGPRGHMGRMGRMGPWGPGNLLGAAATYIGIPQATLMTDLGNGQTLAQIATGAGKTVAGLEQAMLTSVQTQLQKAVTAGKLTSAQEQARLTKIQKGIAQMVNQKWQGRGGHMWGPRPAPRNAPTTTPSGSGA